MIPSEMDCECINWARENIMAPGHHKNCQYYDPTITLLDRLRRGIERWADDEDGIPDFLVEDYIKLREVLCDPCSKEQLKKLRDEE